MIFTVVPFSCWQAECYSAKCTLAKNMCCVCGACVYRFVGVARLEGLLGCLGGEPQGVIYGLLVISKHVGTCYINMHFISIFFILPFSSSHPLSLCLLHMVARCLGIKSHVHTWLFYC